MKNKLYVGLKPECGREVFRSPLEPTTETHGNRFLAVIGPFRTKRGAMFCRDHGQGNPHIQHVGDAERIAKHNGNHVGKFSFKGKRNE